MGHIFISYSKKDIVYVEKLIKALQSEGFDPWVDREGLGAGTQWRTHLEKQIETCDVYLPIISRNSKGSKWVHEELEFAQSLNKPIFPLRLDNTEPFFEIRTIQYEDIRQGKLPSEAFYQRLAVVTPRAQVRGRGSRMDQRKEVVEGATQLASHYMEELSNKGKDFVSEASKILQQEEEIQPQEEIQPVEVNRLFSISTDQSSGADKLNYTRFVDAFTTLVRNPEAKTPITIGIYGQWGSGKSFLMNKVIQSLQDDQPNTSNINQGNFSNFFHKLFRKKANHVDTIIIEFNAWVYSGSEHLWASLVTHLYREIEKFFGVRAHYHRLKKALQRTLPRTLGVFAFYAVLGLIASLILNYNSVQTAGDKVRIAVNAVGASVIGGSVLASLPVLWSALREFADTLFLSRAMNLQKLAAKPDFRDQIGIMADIKAEIGFISHLLENRNKKQQTRIVLFIDDLDRCEHQKAVEVLQAIMLLLADRDGSPFIIFLGIDARVMVRAVEEHYGDVLVKAGINGYEYLDKIVQIPFVIPSASREDIGNYVDSLIWTEAEKELVRSKFMPKEKGGETGQKKPVVGGGKSGTSSKTQSGKPPSAPKDQEPKADQTESVPVTFRQPEREAIESCVDDIADNPRKIKRIINIYRLVRLLLPPNFQEYKKIVRWILLTEQWPLHASWIIEEIENDKFLEGKLSKNENANILDVYDQVKDNIYADDMDSLMTIDAEPILFNQYIQKSPVFTVQEIYDLLYPLTFNLNPAIKSEISKYTAKMAENYIQTKSNRNTKSKRVSTKSNATQSASVKKAIKTKSETVSDA